MKATKRLLSEWFDVQIGELDISIRGMSQATRIAGTNQVNFLDGVSELVIKVQTNKPIKEENFTKVGALLRMCSMYRNYDGTWDYILNKTNSHYGDTNKEFAQAIFEDVFHPY